MLTQMGARRSSPYFFFALDFFNWGMDCPLEYRPGAARARHVNCTHLIYIVHDSVVYHCSGCGLHHGDDKLARVARQVLLGSTLDSTGHALRCQL